MQQSRWTNIRGPDPSVLTRLSLVVGGGRKERSSCRVDLMPSDRSCPACSPDCLPLVILSYIVISRELDRQILEHLVCLCELMVNEWMRLP